MSYLVLARKYRPQSFETVSGQEHITASLNNAIKQDRVPHALIFSGPRGVGKTTIARVLAKSLNCLKRQEEKDNLSTEPCGECSNCLEITKGSSFSVLEIDGASNNSVENVRSLIDSLYSLPPPGYPFKVYIIDEVHMLSVSAFNALLKSLEEPPPNTVFIFATTELHKIPETVVSRCQRYDFQRLEVADICKQLENIVEKENFNISSEVIRFIALRSQGGMRDAQSLLDRIVTLNGGSADSEISMEMVGRYFGVLGKSFFNKLSKAVLESDSQSCLLLLDQAFSHSLDIKSFSDSLVSHFRSLLIMAVIVSKQGQDFSFEKLGKDEQSLLEDFSKDELCELAASLESSQLIDVQRIFGETVSLAESAVSSSYPRYIFEAGLVKISLMPSLVSVTQLLSSGAQIGEVKSQPLIVNSKEIQPRAPEPRIQKKSINKATERVEAKAELKESPAPAALMKPVWQDFVNHVKENSGHILSAYLRRVSATYFEAGVLKLKASSFDAKSLQDSETLQNLKTFLGSYSGIQNWKIEIESIDISDSKSKVIPSASSAQVQGSIALKEEDLNRDRKARILKEARDQEAVKEVLKTFEGSTVDGVKLLAKL